MVVLDLYVLLFSRPAHGECGYVSIHRRAQVRSAGCEPALPSLGLTWTACSSRGDESGWFEHWQVAAKCGWRVNVRSASDAGGNCVVLHCPSRKRKPF